MPRAASGPGGWLLAQMDLPRHLSEDAGKPSEGVLPVCDGAQAVRVETLGFDRLGRRDDVPDLFEVFDLQIPQPFFGEGGFEPGFEQAGLDGFGEIVGGADLDAHGVNAESSRRVDQRAVAHEHPG